jgi:hypothetical protein
MSEDNRACEFRPIYFLALQRIRDLWLELDPLVDVTSYDNVVTPTELQISLSNGPGDAESARLNIQWSELWMYSITSIATMSTGDSTAARIHAFPRSTFIPHRMQPRRQPNRPVSPWPMSLVTREVHAMWRAAYENAGTDQLNSPSNPPESTFESSLHSE